MLSDLEKTRFSRQILLPKVGSEGQEQLKQARILCVGIGGLGSPAALYLAAAGVGHVGLVDHDEVDESNLPRQILYRPKDIRKKKTDIAAKRLKEFNPNIGIESIPEKFSAVSALDLISRYDAVVDSTDNFSAKFLINDAGVKAGVPVIYGSIYQFEGQTSVFWAKQGPCYRCFLPALPQHYIPNCAEAGVLGPVAGVIGSIQAIEAIKMILFQKAHKGGEVPTLIPSLLGKLLIFDGLKMQFSIVQISKNKHCSICSLPPNQISLREEMDNVCKLKNFESIALEIMPAELLKEDFYKTCILIDVREPHEWKISHLPNAQNWPLSRLESGEQPFFEPKKTYILYCQSGFRSKKALQLLYAPGIRIQHLLNGMAAWDGPKDLQ